MSDQMAVFLILSIVGVGLLLYFGLYLLSGELRRITR